MVGTSWTPNGSSRGGGVLVAIVLRTPKDRGDDHCHHEQHEDDRHGALNEGVTDDGVLDGDGVNGASARNRFLRSSRATLHCFQ